MGLEEKGEVMSRTVNRVKGVGAGHEVHEYVMRSEEKYCCM